ncbi:hypothetical protein LEMLEM_LOCUS8653, partial [Lemmus lemmus]
MRFFLSLNLFKKKISHLQLHMEFEASLNFVRPCLNHNNILKSWAGEMAQWLRALPPLLKVLSSIP